MNAVAIVLIAIVAALHVGFLVLEMFLWTKPVGRRIFRLSAAEAQASEVLAANQGLYNGFLATGLIWSLVIDDRPVATFFLACIAVAGIYGALTVNRRVFFVQALPALVALVVMWI
ncbi:MAG TPA: DUF1304 domain-containing protein [Acidimicrobiia bacterium]